MGATKSRYPNRRRILKLNKDNYLEKCPTCGHEILLKAKLLNKLDDLWSDLEFGDIDYKIVEQISKCLKIWQDYKVHYIIPSVTEITEADKEVTNL